jgi:hypothetical protein
MMCFIHFFTIMVGDLVPHNDAVWNYLLTLCKLVELVLVPSYDNERLTELQRTSTKHNTLFLNVFKEYFILKDHLITHYITIILNSGPLKYLWCFRHESKHKEITYYTHAINSRINIAYSAALKLSFKFAYSILFHNLFEETSMIFDKNLEPFQNKFYFQSVCGDELLYNVENENH